MVSLNQSLFRSVRSTLTSAARASAMLAAAGVALVVASAPALAQDCKLSVMATPNVLYAGQSASVDVAGYFPTDIYAFASSQFDVHSTLPKWSYVSSGAVAGGDVLGINVWQTHSPQTGAPANPANPYRVWRGTFTPTTNAPALIEISADPSAISVYPNRLTSSWIPGVATGGSDWVFVNPLSVGRWVAAPGEGTIINVREGVAVSGRITGVTTDPVDSAVHIGLLLPAVQKVRESSVLVHLDGQPESFTAAVQVDAQDGQLKRVGLGTLVLNTNNIPSGIADRPAESLSINYTKIQFRTTGLPSSAGDAGAYVLSADLGDSDVTLSPYHAFRGGIQVASGHLDTRRPSFWVDRVPDGFSARLTPTRTRDRAGIHIEMENVLVSSWSASGQGAGLARIILPSGEVILADTIEVKQSRPLASNNITQFGLTTHTFEATGVRSMTITPAQPR